MKRFSVILVLLLVVLGAHSGAWAVTSKTLVVLPFENASKAPGLEWIGEAFCEVLGQRLASPTLFIVSRDDRIYAFDRAGVPQNVRPSRATLYRIAEQMDVDYVVLGAYRFDGETFSATAQLLDLKALKLSGDMTESAPLVKLLDVQNGLAWDILRQLDPTFPVPKDRFVAQAPAIRLDAFEAYVRGMTATARPDKLKYFRDAVRLNPTYWQAVFHLGRTYFNGREYEAAASWFSRIPKTEALAREANFFAGLSYLYLAQYDKADASLNFVAQAFPLTEVYNNLGVVEARRGRPDALEYFQKAVQADPHDADYHFNLSLALYRSGDTAGATREIREALKQKPNDAEAKSLLDTISQNATFRAVDAGGRKLPPERVKRNYDENSFRQLALGIENAQEARLASSPPKEHADFHVNRGRDLLSRGFSSEAEKEFREAIGLDPKSAGAHAGIAQILENANNAGGARWEAETSIKLQPSAAAYLVLANLDVKENKLQSAADNVNRALALEPANQAALTLKRELAQRQQAITPVAPQ